MNELEIFKSRLANIDIKTNLLPFNMLHTAYQYAYQKENLHSQFLAGLLNPHNSHGLEENCLISFFNEIDVETFDYEKHTQSVKVETERNINGRRIDIFIEWQDENNQKYAVIIENKLNGAVDQPNQLNDYYSGITQEGYSVEKIVYLCFNAHTPSYDVEEIKSKLQIVDIDWLIEWINETIGELGLPVIEWADLDDAHWRIKRFGLLYQYREFLEALKATKFTYMKAKEIIEQCSIEEINKLQNLASLVNTTEWCQVRFEKLGIGDALTKRFGERLQINYCINSDKTANFIELFFTPYQCWVELWLYPEAISLYLVSEQAGKYDEYECNDQSRKGYYYSVAQNFKYNETEKLLATIKPILENLEKSQHHT